MQHLKTTGDRIQKRKQQDGRDRPKEKEKYESDG